MNQEAVSLSAAVAEIPVDGGPDKVAGFLLAKGIRGPRWNGADCPLARYLRMRTGVPADSLIVGVDYVHRRWIADDGLVSSELVRLPPVVARFVARFDEFNAYPRLLGA